MLDEITKCPICGRVINGCHCRAEVYVIGKKLPKRNRPNYTRDATDYDWEHWCICGATLGINKKIA